MQEESVPDNVTNPFVLTTTRQADSIPNPVISKSADQDVLAGKKPWPAISSSAVEDEPTTCILCGVDFITRSRLHAHLCDHKHLPGNLDKAKKFPLYSCKSCFADVHFNSVTKHGCFIKHAKDIVKVEDVIRTEGCPATCIFCRGRVLPSRSHLIIHIIFSHSPYRNPFRCPFCNVEFHSDNLLMQELHAFEYHIPELDFINRLACNKQLDSSMEAVVDGKAPYICLYDPKRVESASWMEAVKDNTNETPSLGPCFHSYKSLAEFTAHIYCCHTIVPPLPFMSRNLNASEKKKLDGLNANLPGPTITDLIKNSITGIVVTNINELERQRLTLGQYSCHICFKSFKYDENLQAHISAFHTVETKKRVQHLIEVGEMDKGLNIYRFCTECFIMFPSVYQLQVHILVSHGGTSWCNCGICDERFCEPEQILPNELTVKSTIPFPENEIMGGLTIPEDVMSATLLQRLSFEENLSFHEDLNSLYEVFEAKLPALFLCKIFEIHENGHLTDLQPPIKYPYLQVNLIKQLLESRGHQAKQIYDWLSTLSDQASNKEPKSFRYEDPNSRRNRRRKNLAYMRLGEHPLSSESVEIGLKLLDTLTGQEKKTIQKGLSLDAENKLKTNARSSLSSDIYSKSIEMRLPRTKETSVRSSTKKSSLPDDLVQHFARIGRRRFELERERTLAEL